VPGRVGKASKRDWGLPLGFAPLRGPDLSLTPGTVRNLAHWPVSARPGPTALTHPEAVDARAAPDSYSHVDRNEAALALLMWGAGRNGPFSFISCP